MFENTLAKFEDLQCLTDGQGKRDCHCMQNTQRKELQDDMVVTEKRMTKKKECQKL